MRPLVILTVLGFSLSCQTKLSGQLLDEQKQPIIVQHGKINLISLETPNKDSHIITLGDDGWFETEDELQPGTYMIEPLIPGYRFLSKKLRIEESQTIHLTLEKIPGSNAKTIDINDHVKVGRGEGEVSLTPPKY